MGLRFTKMHGLGNDFVIVDGRSDDRDLSPATIRAIADRHAGVGCDQFIVLQEPEHAGAKIRMRIHNADGQEVEACGNATRCVADMLFREAVEPPLAIQTTAGVLWATPAGDQIAVDMGPAKLEWDQIPLTREVDTCHLPLRDGDFRDPVAVNIGNPHAVFFVDDAEDVPLSELGPRFEHDDLFPNRANIGAAQQTAPNRLRLRVWERGVGLTKACGTGACAAVVAATRRGLVDRQAFVQLDGGTLNVEWRADGHVMMTGDASVSFTGDIDDRLLGQPV